MRCTDLLYPAATKVDDTVSYGRRRLKGTLVASSTNKGGTDPAPSTSSVAHQIDPRSLPVREGEDPWTQEELDDLRRELADEAARLRAEVEAAELELADLMRDYGDGAGDDQADAGSATLEREQELSLANNTKELLQQVDHALGRIEDGTYGQCESCGQPIGKMRLQAFPRATLCLTCKQKQERR